MRLCLIALLCHVFKTAVGPYVPSVNKSTLLTFTFRASGEPPFLRMSASASRFDIKPRLFLKEFVFAPEPVTLSASIVPFLRKCNALPVT